MNKKQKRWRNRIILALAIFAVVFALEELGALTAVFGTPGDMYASFVLFLVPYLIAGYDVLIKAARNIRRGQAFDECFLMTVATIGAFAMVFFPDTDPHMAEGAAVMLFYQVGELFQSYAVGQSRKSISAMMDIAPDYANIEVDGRLEQVDPDEVAGGRPHRGEARGAHPHRRRRGRRRQPARHRRPHRRVRARATWSRARRSSPAAST